MASDVFSIWLTDKLKELQTDENVFSAYIIGILEGDESNEEKSEALEEILSEIIGTNIKTFINEILEKWQIQNSKEHQQQQQQQKVDVDEHLAKLLETQKLQTTKQKHYTDEEKKIRQQILEQYSQLSADEEDDPDGNTGTGDIATGGPGRSGVDYDLIKNTNQHDVAQLAKERREQAKLESQKKKDKDKEDREKQKQQREEKKEKRKTVKGERRR